MDPLAHTLVGATLAETGLKRTTALGTATLIIGANLPDIDGVVMLAGRDAALLHRRGLTHGVLAMVLLPLALAGSMLLLDRLLARRRPHTTTSVDTDDAPPPPATPTSARFAPLLLLACLSVWSHPFLDWLNEYGVRLLMPFHGGWFYGDALFIIEPWLWLLGACAVVLAHSRGKPARIAWLALLLATTAMVTTSKLTPPEAKLVWCVAGGLIVYLRLRDRPPNLARTAVICSVGIALYITLMLVGTARANARADAWLRTHGLSPDEVAATPVAARPFRRDVIARVGDRYHFLDVPWLGEAAIKPSGPPIAIGPRDQAVQAALALPSLRGLANWLRFPAFRSDRLADGGHRVFIEDVRYSRVRPGGLGTAVVELGPDLRERAR